jgi:hypothetical protein
MLKKALANIPFHRSLWLIPCAAIAATLYVGSGLMHGAQPVGSIIKLSGPLSVKRVNGEFKILGVGAEIEPGDTLMTGDNSYALIRFIDRSEITLRPGTTFRIDSRAAKNLARSSQ